MVGILCPLGAIDFLHAAWHVDDEVFRQAAESICCEFGHRVALHRDGLEAGAVDKGICRDVSDRSRDGDALHTLIIIERLVQSFHFIKELEFVERLQLLFIVHFREDAAHVFLSNDL